MTSDEPSVAMLTYEGYESIFVFVNHRIRVAVTPSQDKFKAGMNDAHEYPNGSKMTEEEAFLARGLPVFVIRYSEPNPLVMETQNRDLGRNEMSMMPI